MKNRQVGARQVAIVLAALSLIAVSVATVLVTRQANDNTDNLQRTNRVVDERFCRLFQVIANGPRTTEQTRNGLIDLSRQTLDTPCSFPPRKTAP